MTDSAIDYRELLQIVQALTVAGICALIVWLFIGDE